MSVPDFAAPGFEPDARLDISADACPMTWVKAKLELEEMEPGEVLEIRVREGESLHNVSTNARAGGCELLGERPAPDSAEGVRLLFVRRGQHAP